jgi:hypothetical protein
MNDKEKESIANALYEISKIFCELAEKLHLIPTQAKNEDLFEPEANTMTQKPRRTFRRVVYVKFKDRNWKRYASLKNLYEEIARIKIDEGKTVPLSVDHLSPEATHDDMIRKFKKAIKKLLAKYNNPLRLEKVARETVDGTRYEA